MPARKYKPRRKQKRIEMVEEAVEEQSSRYSGRTMETFEMDRRIPNLAPDEEDSEPDRSNPPWKVLCPVPCLGECVPEEEEQSISEPLVDIWKEIMTEYEDMRLTWMKERAAAKPFEPDLPVAKKLSAVQYLNKYIFPILLPALEETLFEAKKWECLEYQKCRFSGLDFIAERLWNKSPRHEHRHSSYQEIFDIPFVKIWLHINPRPIYPLSWLWTEEEAIIVLQTYIRRYLVCREPLCYEMRTFWKTLKAEDEEKREARKKRSIEKTLKMFNDILDELVSKAVYIVEERTHGCRCIKTPCNCQCNCFRWCRCCKCSKKPKDDTEAVEKVIASFNY